MEERGQFYKNGCCYFFITEIPLHFLSNRALNKRICLLKLPGYERKTIRKTSEANVACISNPAIANRKETINISGC